MKSRALGKRKDQTSTMKRTLLTHVHMVVIVMSLNVPWPFFVKSFMQLLSSLTSVSANANQIQCSGINVINKKADVLYITLILSALLPFAAMIVTYIYWFVLVPQCTVLSCGEKLKISPWCPGRNPFGRIARTKKYASTGEEDDDHHHHQQQQHLRTLTELPDGWTKETSNGQKYYANRKTKESSWTAPPGNTGGSSTSSASSASSVSTNTSFHSTRDGFLVTNILLIWILTPAIVKSSFSFLQSVKICEELYWSFDDVVLYNSPSHERMKLYVAIPSLLFFGVICPLLAILYIYSHKDRQTNRKLMFRFGLLYSGYSPKLWWWESVLYFRKICIILIVTYASTNKQQLHIALGTLIVLLYLQEHMQPFEQNNATPLVKAITTRLHRLETSSLLVLIIMVWCAVFFVLSPCDDHDIFCNVLGISVLVVNALFAVVCFAIFIKACSNKHHVIEKLTTLSHVIRRNTDTLSKSGRNGSNGSKGSSDAIFAIGGDTDGTELNDVVVKCNPMNDTDDNSLEMITMAGLEENKVN